MVLKTSHLIFIFVLLVNMSSVFGASILNGSFLTYCNNEACPYGSCDAVTGECIVGKQTI
jgi:hypothetical protein